MDLAEAADHLAEFKRQHDVEVLPISCESGDGLDALKTQLRTRVREMPVEATPGA